MHMHIYIYTYMYTYMHILVLGKTLYSDSVRNSKKTQNKLRRESPIKFSSKQVGFSISNKTQLENCIIRKVQTKQQPTKH